MLKVSRVASSSAKEVEEIAAASPLGLPPLAKIGDLHIAINGRFTLNPGQIADLLAKLPGDVKQIVVTTLPKVSAVANLRPQTDRRDQIDFKNSLDQALRVRIDPESIIDNRYLHGGPKFSLPFHLREALDRGGFNSIDGMHPSGAGYAVVASEAMKLLGLAHDRSALLDKTFS